MELIQVKFSKIMQTNSYTMIVVGNEEKRFPIYTAPEVGQILQLSLTGVEKPRPLTHDLISSLLLGLGVRIKQIVINDVQEAVFFARLYVEQHLENIRNIVEIDARPSDCITLALTNNVPVYCTKHVYETAIPIEE